MRAYTHFVSVAGLITNNKGEVLLIKSPRRGWEYPGGMVEPGETLQEALLREIREEAGVTVQINGLIGVCKNIEKDIVNIDFACEYLEGELKTSEESVEVRWFTKSEALNVVTFPLTKKRLENMLSNGGKISCFGFKREPFEVVDEEKFAWNGGQYAKANALQETVGTKLLNSISFAGNEYVLDAGCGSGNLSFQLAKLVPAGHVTAIDLSESMIQTCKEAKEKEGIHNISFQVMGLNELSFSEEFDIVFSNSVLHWVTDIEDAIKRMHRSLKDGGKLAVQFPLLNKNHPLIRYANRAIERLKLNKYYEEWKFPWCVPTKEGLEQILVTAGFQNVSVRREQNSFSFDNVDAAYQHFQSVGLKLYADVLPLKEQKSFMEAVRKELEDDFKDKPLLQYERLYAYGDCLERGK